MPSFHEYKVTFGKIARTLVYEDAQGAMLFSFEIEPSKDPSKGKWTLILGKQPLTLAGKRFEIDISKERLEAALERIRSYGTLRGYQVIA